MSERTLGIASALAIWGTIAATVVFRHQFRGSAPLTVVGLAGVAGGIALIVAGKVGLGDAMARWFTPSRLVTTGIYQKVQHPMYLGGALLLIGLALSLQSVIGICATVLVAWPTYWWSAREEARRLLQAFGTKYSLYRNQTWF